MSVTLAEVEAALTAAQRGFDRRVGGAKALAAQAKAASTEAAALDARSAALEETVAVLLSFADERAAEAIAKVEGTVTHGLRDIFGDESLTFLAESRQVGKRSETEFVVASTGPDGASIRTSVMDARGGGVAAVAGFLLRVVVTLLRPDVRPILFLDETFAQVSAEYEPALADFLAELCAKTSMQIVLVTHSHCYSDVADKEYRITQENGRTSAALVGG